MNAVEQRDRFKAALQRCEQQVTERDIKIANYEEVLRLIYNNSGWLRTEENRWLLQRVEQAVEQINKR